MRNFEFLEPPSLDEASRMLADLGDGARLLAGGTALLLLMRQRLLNPSHIVHLGGLRDLESIRFDNEGGLRIGALTRIADIAEHPGIAARYPMVASMARRVANPQIRNVATIGGNLCHGDPASDAPACFIAAGARLRVVRGGHERLIDLEKFYTDAYDTVLAFDEIVAEILLPPPAPNGVGAYTRFLRTRAEHRPLVGVGVVAWRGNGGAVCEDIRIAVGAATPVPTRLRPAEDLLRGQRVTRDVVEEAAALGAAAVSPLSDFRGSADYRRAMVRVIVRRTIEAAFAAPMWR